MADNIPIRDNSTGANNDLAQFLESFANNNGELRDILRTLNTTVKNLQRDSNSKDNTIKRETQSRIKNIETLKNFTNSFDETQKILRLAQRNLAEGSRALRNSGVANSLQDFDNKLQEVNSKIQGSIDSTQNLINAHTQEISKSQQEYAELSKKLVDARRRGDAKEIQSIQDRQRVLDDNIQLNKDSIKAERNKLSAEMAQQKKSDELYRRQAEALANSIQSMTSLGSRVDAFKPENAKKWDEFKQSVSDYFRPKQSAQYLDAKSAFGERRQYLMDRTKALEDSVKDNALQYSSTLSAIEYNNAKAQELLANGDSANALDYQDRAQELTERKKELENEKEATQAEFELIKAEYEFLDEAESTLERTATGGSNLLNSTLKFIQKWTTRAIDRELNNLQSAADKVFGSFEDLQKSLGKQLKLSSGAYDDMKDMLMEAADAAGKSIDITQLNEAASSISEMGITNKDLITQMAVGIAKFSESGVSAQLDEETAKQINATYNELLSQGMSSDDAARLATQRFDDIIAIEEQVRQQYGNVIALENGGWQDIQNWTNRMKATGDIQTQEQEREFMASMANAMSSMATYGIQDPTAIFTDIESIIQGTMTDVPAYLQGWLSSNNLGINSTEAMYSAMGSGDMGNISMSLLDYLSQQLTGNATNDAYVSKALGIQLTPEQLRAYNSKEAQIQNAYANADFSKENLEAIGDSVQKGIERGSYLSATAKLEKTNISLMQELASTYQNIPDGAFWMGEGFGEIRSIVDGAMTHLFEFLTALTAGKSLFGGMTGGSGTNGQGGLGNVFKSGLLGGAKVPKGDIGFGTSTFAGHQVNAAGKLTMAAGGIISATSALQNFAESDNFEDGMINTFRDPQFTSGLGMTIGGAIGGPIGGAIGGALGQYVPAASEALEGWLIKTDPFGWIDDTADIWESNAKKIAEASESLQKAADSHASNADTMAENMNSELAMFNQYSESQKIAFAEQMGLIDSQESYVGTEQETNNLFDKAVQEWIRQQQAQIDEERALERGASLVEDTLARVVGVDNAANFSASDMTENKYRNEHWADMVGLNWDEVKDLSDEELAEKFQEQEEHYANVRGVLSKDSGAQLLTDIESYAANNQISDFSDAAAQYIQKIDPNLYNEEEMETVKATLTTAHDLKKEYDEANTEFHKRFQTILDENPGVTNYGDLFDAYKKKYSQFDISGIEGAVEENSSIRVDGAINMGNTMPNLRHSSEFGLLDAGNMGNFYKVDYAKELYDGKYKTGLDFVPVDDYMALLHQGEMVLNKTQADEYRQSSGHLLNNLVNMNGTIQDAIQTTIQNISGGNRETVFDTSSITNSVNTQTDRIEALLMKILQVLTSRRGTGSNLPKSLLQMNSDISLL